MGARRIIGAALIILGVIAVVISLSISVAWSLGYPLFPLLMSPVGFYLLWGIFWGPWLIVFGLFLRRRKEGPPLFF